MPLGKPEQTKLPKMLGGMMAQHARGSEGHPQGERFRGEVL